MSRVCHVDFVPDPEEPSAHRTRRLARIPVIAGIPGVELDDAGRLESIVWEQFPGPIRVLLGNKYVFQPWWDHLNRLPDSADWKERFERANRAASHALADRDTGKVLGVVFVRLYTLRNQLIHGGATWNGSVNREQLRDARAIMSALVPFIIEIMMDSAGEHWGEPCYPVHNDE